MPTEVNGYKLNEPNDPENWSQKEFNLLSAFAGLMPACGSRVVSAGEHYHNILTNQDGVSALFVTLENQIYTFFCVGIGTASPDRKLHVELNDNTDDAVSYPLRLTHTYDGEVPNNSNGIGTGIEFETESHYGLRVGGTIESYYSHPDCFNLALRTMIDGDLTTMLTLDGRYYAKGIICSCPIYGGNTGGEDLYLRSDSTYSQKGRVIIADDGGKVSIFTSAPGIYDLTIAGAVKLNSLTTDNTHLWTFAGYTAGSFTGTGYVTVTISGETYRLLAWTAS